MYWFLGKEWYHMYMYYYTYKNSIYTHELTLFLSEMLLKSHFLRLTINWKIYIFAKEFKMVKVCMMPSYLFPSGKYMQMMTVLKPIAFDVILCMSQLFDYYFYTVSWNLYLHLLVYTGNSSALYFFSMWYQFFLSDFRCIPFSVLIPWV